MLRTLKTIFGRVSAAELAARELAAAECALLESQSGREYAEAMVSYHQRRVSRLKAHLASMQTAANDAAATFNDMAIRRAA